MPEKIKNIFLNIVALLYIIWGIAALFNTLINGGAEYVFYICYAALIVIGIGIFYRNGNLIMSQLNILTIPLLIWSIDYLYALSLGSGSTLFGVADYIFLPGALFGKIISMQHLFNLPLSYFALYLIKIDRKDSWKISFFELTLVYFISLILTSKVNNINCVYESCINFIGNSFYVLTWFGLTFGFSYLTNFVVSKIGAFRKK